jgi:hypothetical protein
VNYRQRYSDIEFLRTSEQDSVAHQFVRPFGALLLCVFKFTLSVRYYNHASLLIKVPQDLEPASSVNTITAVLNHGASHYTPGMRGFYPAIRLGCGFSGRSGCWAGQS